MIEKYSIALKFLKYYESTSHIKNIQPHNSYSKNNVANRSHYKIFTCNHTCTNDLSTVNRFLCFTCNKLVIRSIAEKYI